MSNSEHTRPFAEPPMLLSVTEVAARLECGERTVRKLIADGKLPAVKVEGLTRVKNQDFEAYLDLLPPVSRGEKLQKKEPTNEKQPDQ